MNRSLTLRFSLFLLFYFFAEFAFRGERATVDDTKRIFLLMLGQVTILYTGCSLQV
jgi:hypothetical protein